MDITQEEYDDMRFAPGGKYYMQRRCPQCDVAITYNSKPHNRRPDKTDMRCYTCVETTAATAALKRACAARKYERAVKKALKRIIAKRNYDRLYRRRSRATREAHSAA